MRRPTSVRGSALVAAAVVGLGSWVAGAPGAGAAEQATATGVSLSPTASCAWGDVDIAYTATGAEHRTVAFTAADGTVLRQFEGKTFDPNYQGPEHVLSETKTPPPAGTVVAVRVTVGSAPPTAATSAEFFVLYRCDGRTTKEGGTNTILQTCTGDVGACPASAAAATAAGVPAPTGAQPTSLVPAGATPPTRSSGPRPGAAAGSSGAGPSSGAGAAGAAGATPTAPGSTVVGGGGSVVTAPPSTAGGGAETAAAASEVASVPSSSGLPGGIVAALVVVGLAAVAAGVVVVARRRRIEAEDA